MTQQPDCDSIQIVPDADKLDQYHRQQLSAMLDGELSPDQARFMLRRLQHDVELAERWERWQVCGDVLRGQGNALLPPDFASRVSSAIADAAPQPVEQRARSSGRRGLRWGGGAALAASVAMAALLVVNGLHIFVQLPMRRNKLGKLLCGVVAVLLSAAMIYGTVAAGAVQAALSKISGIVVEKQVTAVIVMSWRSASSR